VLFQTAQPSMIVGISPLKGVLQAMNRLHGKD